MGRQQDRFITILFLKTFTLVPLPTLVVSNKTVQDITHIVLSLAKFLKIKNPLYKDLALAIFLFQIINVTGQLITNPTMLVYYWFFSGFIYLLPVLDDKETEQSKLDEAQKNDLRSANLLSNDSKSSDRHV